MKRSKDIREEASNIGLESIPQPPYRFEDLVNGVTEENLHEPDDFGAPEGEEAW